MVNFKRKGKQAGYNKKQVRLQKDLLKKVEKGNIYADEAEDILNKNGFVSHSSFNERLHEVQRKFLMSNPKFVKGLKEYELRKEKAKQEEEDFPKAQFEGFKAAFRMLNKGKVDPEFVSSYINVLRKEGFQKVVKKRGEVVNWNELSDAERFGFNKRFFKRTLKLLERNQITKKEAVELGRALGLKKPENWWQNYFQYHHDAVPRKKGSVKLIKGVIKNIFFKPE